MKIVFGRMVAFTFVLAFLAFTDEYGYGGYSDSRTQLVNVSYGVGESSRDTVITCRLSFSRAPQKYTSELSPILRQAVFTFSQVDLGGSIGRDTSIVINAGPVTAIHIQQKVGTGDGADSRSNTERNNFVQVSLELSPMILYKRDLEIEETESAVSISVLWPRDRKARRKLYSK